MSDLDEELSRALADAESLAAASSSAAAFSSAAALEGTAASSSAAAPSSAAASSSAAVEGSTRSQAVKKSGPSAEATTRSAGTGARQRSWGLLAGLLGAAGLILFLVFQSAQDAVVYSISVPELLAQKQGSVGRKLRLEGELLPGTLRRRAEPCEYRFRMTGTNSSSTQVSRAGTQPGGTGTLPGGAADSLEVHYPECIIPDTFRDVPGMKVQVTAEGRLSPEGHFQASLIMAKCPSKYDMNARAQKGEAMPHDPLAGGTALPSF